MFDCVGVIVVRLDFDGFSCKGYLNPEAIGKRIVEEPVAAEEPAKEAAPASTPAPTPSATASTTSAPVTEPVVVAEEKGSSTLWWVLGGVAVVAAAGAAYAFNLNKNQKTR